MGKKIDYVGTKVGIWTILSDTGRKYGGSSHIYLGRCEKCGVQKEGSISNLRLSVDTCEFGHRKGHKCSRTKYTEDYSGQTHGQWTLLHEADPGKHSEVKYRARCSCGTERDVYLAPVLRGASRSCHACSRRNYGSPGLVTHGHAPSTGVSPTYRVWASMRRRCEKPDAAHYERYGGRGIKVCERWADFANFLEDMGEKPKGLSIDRIDNDGNYEPGNCRWANQSVQVRHLKKPCAVDGVKFDSISDAAKAYGIHQSSAKWRFRSPHFQNWILLQEIKSCRGS